MNDMNGKPNHKVWIRTVSICFVSPCDGGIPRLSAYLIMVDVVNIEYIEFAMKTALFD